MNAGSITPLQLQQCQYDRMEKAMFDYIESVSDEFFLTVNRKDMEQAVNFFVENTHQRMHTALATVLQQVCRGMGRDQ